MGAGTGHPPLTSWSPARLEPDSVHLCDYPEPDVARRDVQLEEDMALVREVIELGRDARGRSQVKVRQPLPRVVVCGDERVADAVDILVRREPRVGLVLSSRGTLTVAVDTTIEERLRREGLAREIVRVVQAARREAGVAVTDRIELRLGGSEELLGAARIHERYLAAETLATRVAYDGEDGGANGDAAVDVDGEPLAVALAVAKR